MNGPPPAMAVVFQEYGRSLFPWMTVHDNVALPLKQKKMPAARREELVRDALAAVDLANVHGAYPWQLSGGMQQRVAIARAVAYEPHVLLMDEPFAAVDAQTRADLEDLIRVLWRKLRVTVLFVTHDIDESVYLGQRVLVMSHAPTVIMEDVAIDLPGERTQLETRSLAAVRRTAQAHLRANPACQAGLAAAGRLGQSHLNLAIKHSSHVNARLRPAAG